MVAPVHSVNQINLGPPCKRHWRFSLSTWLQRDSEICEDGTLGWWKERAGEKLDCLDLCVRRDMFANFRGHGDDLDGNMTFCKHILNTKVRNVRGLTSSEVKGSNGCLNVVSTFAVVSTLVCVPGTPGIALPSADIVQKSRWSGFATVVGVGFER